MSRDSGASLRNVPYFWGPMRLHAHRCTPSCAPIPHTWNRKQVPSPRCLRGAQLYRHLWAATPWGSVPPLQTESRSAASRARCNTHSVAESSQPCRPGGGAYTGTWEGAHAVTDIRLCCAWEPKAWLPSGTSDQSRPPGPHRKLRPEVFMSPGHTGDRAPKP